MFLSRNLSIFILILLSLALKVSSFVQSSHRQRLLPFSLSTDQQQEQQQQQQQESITFATEEELNDYAKSVGITLSLTTLGPGYRTVARALHDEQQILGYCEGFIRPSGKILHVDKLEVWKKAIDKARKENPQGFKNGGQVFGISLLLGYKAMMFGKEKRCEMAEFLAIDDEPFQHKRLVRFFQRAGFRKIRYVGDDLASVPDRLVWGGCGTLMNRPIEELLQIWSKILMNDKSL